MLELHPLCTYFPRMTAEEYNSLKDDLVRNGQNQPIYTYNGFILDGGNRYRALTEAGVEPIIQEYNGTDPVSFVLSQNLHRRHLSQGQAAIIVASLQDWSQANSAGNPNWSGNKGVSQSDRANQAGVGIRTQRMADKVAREDPELAKKVSTGEITLVTAINALKPETEKPDYPATLPNSDEHDLVKELEEAHKEISRLNQLIASLQKDDSAKEISDWQMKFTQLQGRLNQEIETCTQAKKQAQSYWGLLERIRAKLGVEKNSQILDAMNNTAE
jgi:hypothetical protein